MIIIVGHLIVDAADRDTFVAGHHDLVTRARAFPAVSTSHGGTVKRYDTVDGGPLF